MPDATIRSFYLDGPAGRLEAVLNTGTERADFCAVVAHPHPLFGGTMHNKVVFAAMKALNSFGFPVLRFNFRGVGHSAGTHDYGRGEIDDVRTAIDWLDKEFDLPIIFAGFSFGSAIGLRTACPDRRVSALVALGLPISVDARQYSYQFLGECSKPKLFLSGDNDQYASVENLKAVTEEASEPKRFVVISNADHFFAGRLDEMKGALQLWIQEVLRPDASPV